MGKAAARHDFAKNNVGKGSVIYANMDVFCRIDEEGAKERRYRN